MPLPIATRAASRLAAGPDPIAVRSPTWAVAARAWFVLVCAPMRWQYVVLLFVLGTRGASAQPELPPDDAAAEPAETPSAEPPAALEPPPAAPAQPATSVRVDVPPAPPASAPPPAEPPAAPDTSKDTRIRPDPTRSLTLDRPKHTGFRFGSYGRAIAGTDLRGGKPEKILFVARGSRIVEPSYLELDFSYGFETKRGPLRPVITLAFAGLLFHETGQFDAQPALRNMFLEGAIAKDVHAWVGSRMYRGDDVYLFDFWPLDDLNTLGAGIIYSGAPLELAIHGGVNRLDHPFQYQVVDVPNPAQGATTVEQLNRQRLLASASAAYIARNIASNIHAKFKLHGEVHALPPGTRERVDGTFEALPSDSGFLVGAQVGAFGFAPPDSPLRRHVNLFMRYAKGLAAFDELAPPTSFGPELKTSRASEIQLALSAAWDHPLGNVLVGAMSRRFIDADTTPTDPDDGWEYSIGARPLVRALPDVFVGADISYQARFPRGLNPITLRAEDPGMVQLAPMIVFSPMGPSAYDRPQLRLVYRWARLNEAARNLYVPDDPRHTRETVHFLGAQAEWWFNSNTYR